MFGDDFWSDLWDRVVEAARLSSAQIIQKTLVYAGDTISLGIELLNENVTEKPDTWNGAMVKLADGTTSTLFDMLKGVTDAAILPIAVAIMVIVLCYDFISSLLDKNNFKEVDMIVFFQFALKGCISIYIMSNIYSITGALFSMGAWIADKANSKLIQETSALGDVIGSEEFLEKLLEFNSFDLCLAFVLSLLVAIVTLAIIIIVLIVTAGRMIEILMTISVAPIPFATLVNKEWGSMGTNYIKTLLALALQAFFIVMALAIYILVYNFIIIDTVNTKDVYGSGSLTLALIKWLCYGIICCFMLLKSGSLAKSICGAH